MRTLPTLVTTIALALGAFPAHAGLDAAWKAAPARVPADSLPAVLLAMEARGAPGVRPGEAAYALGQFRYMRGEYPAAVDPFLRAFTRLTGQDRYAARYAHALASLALGNTAVARAAFLEVADEARELRSLALLGVAQSWDVDRRPEKAFDTLRILLAGDPGEAGPAALERFTALATQFRRETEARAARARLAKQYPQSIEAARLGSTPRPREAMQDGLAPSRLPAP